MAIETVRDITRMESIPANGADSAPADIIISTRNLQVWYGDRLAVNDVSLDFERNRITAIIGPSGCGKSTLRLQPHE